MSNQTQQHEQQAGQAFSQDEFSALLNKEFRPKTDQARSAVESAVKTLAQHRHFLQRHLPHHSEPDRRYRRAAVAAGKPDHSPRRVSEAGERLARSELSGEQH